MATNLFSLGFRALPRTVIGKKIRCQPHYNYIFLGVRCGYRAVFPGFARLIVAGENVKKFELLI